MDRRKPRIFRESFQLKIVKNLVTAGVFSLVILALLGFVVLFWTPAAKEIGLFDSGTGILLILAKVFLIVTVVLLGLILWISFLISKNLFGPLTRLRNQIQMLIEGRDTDTIRFRKSDELEFHYISEPFNQLVDKVLEQRKAAKELERDITDFIDKNEKGMVNKMSCIPFIKELSEKVKSITKFS